MADNEGTTIADKNQVGFNAESDFAVATAAAIFGLQISKKFNNSVRLDMEVSAFQNQVGSENFIINKGGAIKTIDGKSEDERENKDREAFMNYMSIIAEQRTREREEWARTQHTYFGATLTGSQWGELGNRLETDTQLQKWLIARLMKDGGTREEAERKVQEFASIASILAKPESQWSKEERTQIDAAKSNNQFNTFMPILAEQALGGDFRVKSQTALIDHAPRNTEAGAETFASAPNLSEHHNAAQVAKTPLDAPKPLSVTLEATAPEPSMGGLG